MALLIVMLSDEIYREELGPESAFSLPWTTYVKLTFNGIYFPSTVQDVFCERELSGKKVCTDKIVI